MKCSAILIEGVTKWFERYASPQERFKRLFSRGMQQPDRFYALRDVHFEVKEGSAVGLLGRNGAGKSTLMQIIAGTMRPSEGRIVTYGRISPLLELGTAFNPEYTGTENVRINAAVLGFSAQEIRRKEREIADFADIDEFIDRPVKTYSSGMFARLAFAVAINVEPRILLVDEILTVGDMGFQQKCLGRLREMREEGVTLVFVSHSPDAVKSICDTGVFLDHGQVAYAGPADIAVDRYLAFIREAMNAEQLRHEETQAWRHPVPRKEKLDARLRYGSGHVQIVRADVLDEDGTRRKIFRFGEVAVAEVEILSTITIDNLSINLHFRDDKGLDMFGTTTFDERVPLRAMQPGMHKIVRFKFTVVSRIGVYGAVVSVTRVTHRDYSDVFLFDQAEGIVSFEVMPDPNRPVHYKFHVPMAIEEKSSDQAAAA